MEEFVRTYFRIKNRVIESFAILIGQFIIIGRDRCPQHRSRLTTLLFRDQTHSRHTRPRLKYLSRLEILPLSSIVERIVHKFIDIHLLTSLSFS
ncbi:hypothetical protein D3C78_1571450 [compost metagenome]